MDLHARVCCHQHTIKWCIDFHQSSCWPHIYHMYWYWTLNISRYLYRYFNITEQTQCIHILPSEPSYIELYFPSHIKHKVCSQDWPHTWYLQTCLWRVTIFVFLLASQSGGILLVHQKPLTFYPIDISTSFSFHRVHHLKCFLPILTT